MIRRKSILNWKEFPETLIEIVKIFAAEMRSKMAAEQLKKKQEQNQWNNAQWRSWMNIPPPLKFKGRNGHGPPLEVTGVGGAIGQRPIQSLSESRLLSGH